MYCYSEDWEHIFWGNKTKVVRWVYDKTNEMMLAVQVMNKKTHIWRWANDDEFNDVEDSVKNTNPAIFEEQEDNGDVLFSNELPKWAIGHNKGV